MTGDADGTLYEVATEEMQRLINLYLEMTATSKGLSTLAASHLKTVDQRRMVLAGIGSEDPPDSSTAISVLDEMERRKAVPFNVESAITTGVYIVLRDYSIKRLRQLQKDTNSLQELDAAYIQANPSTLPFLMRMAGIFSKADLQRKIGSASDQRVGKTAAVKLVGLVKSRAADLSEGEVLRGLEATLEGIVRDLVGRLLLESLVENALTARKLPFKRESEYTALTGVIYDFRADFVLPSEKNPLAFIEVRKSSSRHASLYAKDKMFSAINWKGRHPKLLGVLVVDGPWTQATLEVMPKVFDYVVPLTELPFLAETLEAYLGGDESKLKRLLTFMISAPES